MLGIKVREATQADLHSLKEIINDAVKFKVSKNDAVWGTEPWTTSEVAEALGFGNTNIVSCNDKIIGCVDLIWDDSYNWGDELGSDGLAGYIHRLAIVSQFRGRSLGQEIIKWVEDETRARHRKYVRLDCRKNNHSLCAYYEKCGFRRITVSNPRSQTSAYFQKEV